MPPDPLVKRAQDIQAAMELAGNVVNTDNMDADVMEEIAYNELIDDDVIDLGSTVSQSASAFNASGSNDSDVTSTASSPTKRSKRSMEEQRLDLIRESNAT